MAEETTPAAEKAPVEKRRTEPAEVKAPAAKKASAATADADSKKAAAPKTDAATKGPKAAKADAPKAAATRSAATKPAAKSDDAAAASASGATASTSAARKPAAKQEDVAVRPQVLKMHHLRPAPGAKKDRTRVGRGEGSKGKTAGRGTKGTKARYSMRPGFEGGNINFVMRAPKLRGFKNPFRVEYQVVNLEKLAELYPSGGEVTTADLVAKGAVRKNEMVKVLGQGDIAVKLDVAVDKVSGSAEQKIVAAGGSIK